MNRSKAFLVGDFLEQGNKSQETRNKNQEKKIEKREETGCVTRDAEHPTPIGPETSSG